MSSNPPDARDSRQSETSLNDLADSALRKIVSAIVLSGALVALAIYSRADPPRYQAIVGDGQIVRIDTRTGTVIACEENRCMQIVRRGQRLERSLGPAPVPKQDVQPREAPASAPTGAAPAGR